MKARIQDRDVARRAEKKNGPGAELQAYGTVRPSMPVGLPREARQRICTRLNQLLADTMTLRDLYKKAHWHVSGPTFHQLHLLFDKHFGEQVELIDELGERIQTLGGISLAMAHDVAETTRLERPPRGRETVPRQIARLLEAHETIIREARSAAREAAELGDDGTNDLLVSDVVRTNELQAWFLHEHLQPMPLTNSEPET